MNKKYPTILSPGKIGKVELRNKTVMALMGKSQAENGLVNKAETEKSHDSKVF